jgi:1-acyl-sn-glycerol-3-phosphate acyltransferase
MGIGREVRRAMGRTWIRTFGWQIAGGAPAVQKAVVVAAPHTSNWDLPFTLAVAWSLDLDIRWVGKHTLFEKPIWGSFLRSLGGIGVDRRKNSDAVKAIADLMNQHERLLLIVPPEGTRGVAKRWKTGFYWIAVESGVPIVLGFLDYSRKRAGLGDLLHPTGDIVADFARLREFYADVKGKFPDRQGEVSLGELEQRPSVASA